MPSFQYIVLHAFLCFYSVEAFSMAIHGPAESMNRQNQNYQCRQPSSAQDHRTSKSEVRVALYSTSGSHEREIVDTGELTTHSSIQEKNPSHLLVHDEKRRSVFSKSAVVAMAVSSSLVFERVGSTDEKTKAQAATPLPVATNSATGKTIVVTGCNSGIGLAACQRLARNGNVLVLACRTLEKAIGAASQIEASLRDTDSYDNTASLLIPAECDLTKKDSIKRFADDLPSLLSKNGTKGIDILCLNAGLARNTSAKDCARTSDGFELTVGTNHVGHFYLNHLLLPKMTKDGQIIVTASSVHDPSSPGGAQGAAATLGELHGLMDEGRQCEMLDGAPFNPDKAYKDSKLCNILFMRELQERLQKEDSTKSISVNAFSPGLIVGTGFFRDQNPVFTKLFDVAATNLLKVGETPDWGGAALAYMTLITSKGLYYNSPAGSSKYGDSAFGTAFVPSEVSIEAQDNAKGKLLWELTSKALEISA